MFVLLCGYFQENDGIRELLNDLSKTNRKKSKIEDTV